MSFFVVFSSFLLIFIKCRIRIEGIKNMPEEKPFKRRALKDLKNACKK